jgi:DNA-binding winged helix-turn-helix (wHTH) protein
MARVWPDRIVEDNSLQAQISALRAAFGAERGLIRTVAGRGYQFTGEIRILVVRRNHRIPFRLDLCNDAGCARGSASK